MLMLDSEQFGNINDIFVNMVREIQRCGVKNSSRNGDVLVFPYPVMTIYRNPRNRVLMHSLRKANHFFHFFESLWMLAGHQELDFLLDFNPRMAEYSDDGKNIRGSAYGHRWRSYFDYDQLEMAYQMLKISPDSRRVVVNHFDPRVDLGASTKDVPCNTQIMFSQVRGKLDMTVINRSNDMIWGAYGSNVVHFSILHEYMAMKLGWEMGVYYQYSNNMHVYLENEVWQRVRYAEMEEDPYRSVSAYPMSMDKIGQFDYDLNRFFELAPMKVLISEKEFGTTYFQRGVTPMWNAWRMHKEKKYIEAFGFLNQCQFFDFRKACNDYLLPHSQKAAENAKRTDDRVHETVAGGEG